MLIWTLFVYQPTFSILELKEDKSTDYLIDWKPKGVYAFRITPLYTAFLHNIKLSWCRARIQFDNSVLVVG